MTREEIIMATIDRATNLSKKYCNVYQDFEDYESIGVVKIIEAVDYCIANNINNLDEIQKMANVYARNGILKEMYRQKETSVENYVIYNTSVEADLDLLLEQFSNELENTDLLDSILSGETPQDYCDRKEISVRQYYLLKKELRDFAQKYKSNVSC